MLSRAAPGTGQTQLGRHGSAGTGAWFVGGRCGALGETGAGQEGGGVRSWSGVKGWGGGRGSAAV